MKPYYLSRTDIENKSMTIDEFKDKHFLKIWHFHKEVEFVYIKKGKGNLFVGGEIEGFTAGELFLIGSDLPHMWLSSDEYFMEESRLLSESLAIHFKKEIIADVGLIPEYKKVHNLVKTSERGIHFSNVPNDVIKKIYDLKNLSDFKRVLSLLEILDTLAATDYKVLTTDGYIRRFKPSGRNNLDKVYSYIFNNFHKTIRLDEVAEIAHMNSSAFSRFFKKMNNKTLVQYINEIRVGYACKLLLEDTHSVSQICYECGFNNVSNFNRQFKMLKGVTPKEFIKERGVLKPASN